MRKLEPMDRLFLLAALLISLWGPNLSYAQQEFDEPVCRDDLKIKEISTVVSCDFIVLDSFQDQRLSFLKREQIEINPFFSTKIERGFDVASVKDSRRTEEVLQKFQLLHQEGHDYTQKNMDDVRQFCWKETILTAIIESEQIQERFKTQLKKAFLGDHSDDPCYHTFFKMVNIAQTLKIQLEKIEKNKLRSEIGEGDLLYAQNIAAEWLKTALNLLLQKGLHKAEEKGIPQKWERYCHEMEKANKMLDQWLMTCSPN